MMITAHTEETKNKIRIKMIGNKNACGIRSRKINWDDKEEMRQYYKKHNSKRKEYLRKWFMEMRHRKGISKKYLSQCVVSHSKEYRKFYRKKMKYMRKKAGELTIETIQHIYEDNIKKHGTLTCYLCLLPIPFGKDNLEHKIPISRGGSNDVENLSIACQKCNFKKHTKTDSEYLMEEKIKCLPEEQLY